MIVRFVPEQDMICVGQIRSSMICVSLICSGTASMIWVSLICSGTTSMIWVSRIWFRNSINDLY
jgi:hypothetical protein